MADILHFCRLGNVEDQGVILGTALGNEDLGNGFFVKAIGTQAIYGFCGQRDQAAVFDDFRGGSCRGGVLCG